jgi:hypothetical protein
VQSQKDLVFMKELLKSGKIVPVIDGCYLLSKIAEAFQYYEKVHPKGKVVITVEHDNNSDWVLPLIEFCCVCLIMVLCRRQF